jgi:hypothetical protein
VQRDAGLWQLSRNVLDGVHFDAARFEQAQGKLGIADLHRQGLASARATAQQMHRLTRDKAQLPKPTSGLRQLGIAPTKHTRYHSMGAAGQFGQ